MIDYSYVIGTLEECESCLDVLTSEKGMHYTFIGKSKSFYYIPVFTGDIGIVPPQYTIMDSEAFQAIYEPEEPDETI